MNLHSPHIHGLIHNDSIRWPAHIDSVQTTPPHPLPAITMVTNTKCFLPTSLPPSLPVGRAAPPRAWRYEGLLWSARHAASRPVLVQNQTPRSH